MSDQVAVKDCEGTALSTGDRVVDDGWFGTGTVVRLRIPLEHGDGFNVGVKWDDASKGGPRVRDGGRGANHLRRIGGPIEVAPAAAATAWTAETMHAHPRFEEFVTFMRNENEDADWAFHGAPETVELWVDWLTDDDDTAGQGGAAEAAALQTLADSYTGEFEAAALDSAFPMTLIPDEPHPTPPKAPPYVAPEEGMFVNISRGGASEHAFVFTSTANQFGVCYQDRTWEGIMLERAEPWTLASAVDLDAMPGGIILSRSGAYTLPEGFLFGLKSNEIGWQWFTEYKVGGPADPKCYTPSSRLPNLKAGQHVECMGKVLGGGGDGAVLIAIAQCREKPTEKQVQEGRKGQWRRFAVVALSGELRMAELMSADQGFIKASEPLSCISESELQSLLVQVPSFLKGKVVSTLQTQLSRAAPTSQQQQLRPRKTRTTAAASSASSTSPLPPESEPKPPNLSHDLKNVQVRTLRALTEGQLK